MFSEEHQDTRITEATRPAPGSQMCLYSFLYFSLRSRCRRWPGELQPVCWVPHGVCFQIGPTSKMEGKEKHCQNILEPWWAWWGACAGGIQDLQQREEPVSRQPGSTGPFPWEPPPVHFLLLSDPSLPSLPPPRTTVTFLPSLQFSSIYCHPLPLSVLENA